MALFFHVVRDGPLENLWGRGRGRARAKYKIIYSSKGKLNEKNSCTPINPKKYSCYGLKKIHTRNLITKKNSCGSKIPHSPHNFSNGLYLICFHLNQISSHRMPKVYTFFLDSNFFRVLKITQETGNTASLRTTETKTNIGLKN